MKREIEIFAVGLQSAEQIEKTLSVCWHFHKETICHTNSMGGKVVINLRKHCKGDRWELRVRSSSAGERVHRLIFKVLYLFLVKIILDGFWLSSSPTDQLIWYAPKDDHRYIKCVEVNMAQTVMPRLVLWSEVIFSFCCDFCWWWCFSCPMIYLSNSFARSSYLSPFSWSTIDANLRWPSA